MKKPIEINYNDYNATAICPKCGEPCKVIPLDNAIDYAGTHCTHGKSGTYYPADYGSPVSSCCEVLIDPDKIDFDEIGF